jgi:hypothetical protein
MYLALLLHLWVTRLETDTWLAIIRYIIRYSYLIGN